MFPEIGNEVYGWVSISCEGCPFHFSERNTG